MRRFVSLIACLLLPMGVALSQQRGLDGTGWKALSVIERVQFVDGYIDCYISDLGDKKGTFLEGGETYAPRITRYYERHPGNTREAVIAVLFKVRSRKAPKPLEGGEVWTEKHGVWNGAYWHDLASSEQTAFINGYLACYRENLGARPKKFSKPAVAYARLVSDWYDEPSVSLETTDKRHEQAIAEVLHRFADSKPASSRQTPVLPPTVQPQRERVSEAVANGLLCGTSPEPQSVRSLAGSTGGAMCGGTPIRPLYPPMAKQARIQGPVKMKAVIGKDGKVKNLEVLEGHPMLVPAAIEAVKEWRYRPYTVHGKPVEVETTIVVNFTLGGG